MPAFFIEQRFWCWVKFDLHAWGNNKRNLLRNEMDCNHIERIEIVPWVGREGRLPPCKWPIEEESTMLSKTQHVSMFEEWHTELLPSRDFHCLQLESTCTEQFFKDREREALSDTAPEMLTLGRKGRAMQPFSLDYALANVYSKGEGQHPRQVLPVVWTDPQSLVSCWSTFKCLLL